MTNDREWLARLVKTAVQFRSTPIVDDDFTAFRNAFDYDLEAAERFLSCSRPIVVVLCGSTRFYDAFQRANYDETMAGRIVLSVGHYPNAPMHGQTVGCTPAQKVELDKLHLRKIDQADEILVLNCGGYLGESTRREIDYAKQQGKPIRYLEPISTTSLPEVVTA